MAGSKSRPAASGAAKHEEVLDPLAGSHGADRGWHSAAANSNLRGFETSGRYIIEPLLRASGTPPCSRHSDSSWSRATATLEPRASIKK